MSKKQNDAAAPGAPIPRRAALAAAAAFAGAMMWNPEAFGWENCTDPTNQANVRGWSGTANSFNFGDEGGDYIGNKSTLSYGLKCQSWTKWMHWNMGNGVGWLGTQMDLVSTTDFETELTFHNTYLPLVAGFSNSIQSQGWKKTDEHDSSYSLGIWKSDNTEELPITSSFDMDTSKNSPFPVHETSWLDEGHYDYWTDLQLWGDTWSLFPRRGASADRELWARMHGSWWDFYHFGYYNCTVYGQTKWLLQYVPKVKITLTAEGWPTCGLEWAGRILNIRSYTDNSKCLFVGNSVKVADSGTKTGIWGGPYTLDATNRQWACVLNGNGTTDPAAWSNTNRWAGTVSFANVMQVAEGSEAVWLDQAGGGPTTTKNIAGEIYTGNGSAAQAFWVHTDGDHQMIFSDASGHALARDYNKDDDGTTVMFWSDGDGKDLEDKGCWWVLDDARFSLRPGMKLNTISTSPDGIVRDEGICVGDTVSFPDLKPLTFPRSGYDDQKLGYDYMWVAIDEADDGKWLDDQVEVWARAHVGDMGTLPVEQPTINVVGACGLHALEAVHLRVKGSSLSGGIEYRYRNRSTGTWQDWVSGSADDDGTGSDAWAGEKSAGYRADGFSARLTGELAKRYTLFYKVASGASGWSAWGKDGADCIDPKSHIDAICVRILPKWANDDEYGFGASQNEMKVTEDMVGKKIIPVCRAFIKQSSIGLLYLGTVAGSADVTSVTYDKVELILRVDGEKYEPIPDEKLLFEEGVPIVVDPSWTEGAKKFGGRDETCSGFDGWYLDPECTTPWVDGYVPKKGTDVVTIYARNKVVIDFKPSTHALSMMGGLALTDGDGNPASVADMPPAWSGWYGDKVTIPAPADTTLYAMDAEKKRTYTCTAGVYARDWDGSGTAPQLIPFGTHPVTSSGTRYYDWLDSPYDGFIGR